MGLFRNSPPRMEASWKTSWQVSTSAGVPSLREWEIGGQGDAAPVTPGHRGGYSGQSLLKMQSDEFKVALLSDTTIGALLTSQTSTVHVLRFRTFLLCFQAVDKVSLFCADIIHVKSILFLLLLFIMIWWPRGRQWKKSKERSGLPVWRSGFRVRPLICSFPDWALGLP